MSGPYRFAPCPFCQRGQHDGEGVPANARLIAAAPDLLAALSGLVDVQPESETLDHDLNGCDGCALCSARQAIAKAKGEA